MEQDLKNLNGSKNSCNFGFLVSELVVGSGEQDNSLCNISTKIGHNFRKICGFHRKHEFCQQILFKHHDYNIYKVQPILS